MRVHKTAAPSPPMDVKYKGLSFPLISILKTKLAVNSRPIYMHINMYRYVYKIPHCYRLEYADILLRQVFW